MAKQDTVATLLRCAVVTVVFLYNDIFVIQYNSTNSLRPHFIIVDWRFCSLPWQCPVVNFVIGEKRCLWCYKNTYLWTGTVPSDVDPLRLPGVGETDIGKLPNIKIHSFPTEKVYLCYFDGRTCYFDGATLSISHFVKYDVSCTLPVATRHILQ